MAARLSKYDATLFGRQNCTYSEQNKLELGEFFDKMIKYVDCDEATNTEACALAGIMKGTPETPAQGGTPTWRIQGETIPGYQRLEDLRRMARLLP